MRSSRESGKAACLQGIGTAGFALALLLAGCTSKGSQPAARRMEGAPVSVIRVAQRSVPVDIQVVGNVEAYSTITVKARVSGELTRVYFQEGDYVKQGDLLFAIDPRPYEAQVGQAEANLARDEAQLGQAEANLKRDIAQANYAKSQSERYYNLFQQGIISKDQAEQIRAGADAMGQAVKADEAAIRSARAAVVAAKAALDTARLMLGYTNIRSPIEGRTGNLAVKQGNLVTATTSDLMTINQVQPIYVTFSVPEPHLPAIKRYMAQGQLAVIATPQEDQTPERGVLTFVDNTVDPTTGTIRLKGTFTNPDRRLWPGQFVRVTLRLTTQPNALVVPNQAVQTGQEGQYVFVVKSDRTVESRPVVTGPRVDQDIVIQQGLQPGETIVTEGHLRLAPGIRVQIREGRGDTLRVKTPS